MGTLSDALKVEMDPFLRDLRRRAADSRRESRASMEVAALKLATSIKAALAERREPLSPPPPRPIVIINLFPHNGSPDRA